MLFNNLKNDGQYLYYYDCENRLVDVNDQSDDPIASYAYDYLGRRVSKTDYTLYPVSCTLYSYDGDQVIAEYDGSDNLLRKYVYGPGIDEPVMMIDCTGQSEVKYYYHFDGLGSVVALSNVNNQVVENYTYDVFGSPSIASSIGNPYMFTGRECDSETGLYYYRARYYNPEIGRFLQTDPVGYLAGLNLYTYCDNNPINWIDPFGLMDSMSAAVLNGSLTAGELAELVGNPSVQAAAKAAAATAAATSPWWGPKLWNWIKDKVSNNRSKSGKTCEKVPGSEETHTDHDHGPYKDGHKHWQEKHTDPKTGKIRTVRRTGPLEK